jgi:hypothetical protein
MRVRPCADAEYRDTGLLGDSLADYRGDALNKHHTRAGAFDLFSLRDKLQRRFGRAALRFISAELPGKLRRKPDMP